MLANADLIIVDTYVQGKTIHKQLFLYVDQNVKNNTKQ